MTREAQRRQAAIVSMDVVGYSMLMATDEESTIATLKRCHSTIIAPAIQSHDGRLIDRAGDSWLIAFESAESAVRFALHVQAQAAGIPREDGRPKMQLRAGINYGEIIEDDGAIYGNGVNVSARLQAIAKPGGISLSSAAREQLGDRLACRYREIGPRMVKNIPKPVWVYRIIMDNESDQVLAEDAKIIDVSHQVSGMEHRPAIAVLPFANLGGDPEQEYFSDGLTEDIINGLSNLRCFPVISRNSTFQFKNAPIDIRDIGRRLGARYVVEGTVRRAVTRLRATAQLASTDDGHAVWSERYERPLIDLFDLQEEIARSIVAAIDPELSRAEQFRSRSRPIEQLDDWNLVRRGIWHLNRLTKEDSLNARLLFDQALMRNPENIEALIQLSWWYFWDVWAKRGPMEGWVDMERFARRAMFLDSQDARARMLTGTALLMQGEAQHGREMLHAAIRANPSLAAAYSVIGTSYILTGEPESAIEPLQTALRLSPNDIYIFHTLGEMAVARYMTGDYGLAMAAAEESLRLRPGYMYAHVVRIGCLARLSRPEEARNALRRFLKKRPNFNIADVEWLPFIDRHWVEYLAEGVRLAGFR